jgi:hypothetical protein
MANGGLVALGVLIIIGMFIFGNVLITPQQKNQIKLASSLCGSPLGAIGGSVSSDVANGCQQVGFLGTILNYELFIYFGGIILLVIGLAIPSGKKEVIREIVKEKSTQKEEPEEEIEEESEIKKPAKFKYCSDCGTKVSKKSKFCIECGKEL